MRNGKPNEAIKQLTRALAFSPDSTSLHFQMATTYMNMGALGDARGHLERCRVLEPGFPDGWAYFADLLKQQGRATESARDLQEGLSACPNSPGLHLMYASRLQEGGAYEEAILEYQESIRLRPEEADASIELANLYFTLDRVDDGVNQLWIALAAEPDNQMALSTLALSSIIKGDQADAGRWMARITDQPRVDGDQIRSLKKAYADRFREPYR